MPRPKSNNIWTGTRTSTRTSRLVQAQFETVGYPLGDVNFMIGPTRDWLGERIAPRQNGPSQITVRDPRAGISPLYGGYVAQQTGGLFDINVDVIHFAVEPAASAFVFLYAAPGRGCPKVMHTEFYAELRNKADNRGYVTVTTTSAHVVRKGAGQAVEIAFRLPGDRQTA